MTAKRALDLALVLPGLALAAPLMLLLAVCVRLALGPGVLFRQQRPGLHGAPFSILKFRTMRHGPGSDAERLTPFGRFLRSTSLDELPELLNVLKGDMSLVGPRPLLMQYLPRYSREQARRHEVPPGITGWAQVHGRNALTWEERFKLDVWYVDNHSLALDLRILARTIALVLRRQGINAQGQATMSEFLGSAPNQGGQPPHD
jgi:lipopolysaccharide/colanic/teichoic acid biosynthesis glycosyltransferase